MNTKFVAGILIAALVATSIGVAAARYGPENGVRYADVNGDGVCDNSGERPEFVDEDGDGVCDNRSIRGFRGYGRIFVDADGDGICDNFGIQNGQDDDYVRPQDGRGKQNGNRRGGNRLA